MNLSVGSFRKRRVKRARCTPGYNVASKNKTPTRRPANRRPCCYSSLAQAVLSLSYDCTQISVSSSCEPKYHNPSLNSVSITFGISFSRKVIRYQLEPKWPFENER